ncbi:MAG: BON domain-containing protein [Chloroflexia bacterium]|nr:BON domain-containing protein [Chloroflexia bacterium]
MTDRARQPSAGQPDELLDRLNHILIEAGIYVAAELRDGILSLSGQVDSPEKRIAALDVATALAEPVGVRIDESIDVLPSAPDRLYETANSTEGQRFGYLDADRDNDGLLDPGFAADLDFTDDIGTTDPQEAAAEAIPYFPPTDPVVRQTDRGREGLEVLGGFSATSMDDTAGDAGFDVRNDDDIARDVLRELREDALTTELEVRVAVRDGVVRLRGEVPTLEDAENAEAVASRAGGVVEVLEEITIPSMSRDSGTRP